MDENTNTYNSTQLQHAHCESTLPNLAKAWSLLKIFVHFHHMPCMRCAGDLFQFLSSFYFRSNQICKKREGLGRVTVPQTRSVIMAPYVTLT